RRSPPGLRSSRCTVSSVPALISVALPSKYVSRAAPLLPVRTRSPTLTVWRAGAAWNAPLPLAHSTVGCTVSRVAWSASCPVGRAGAPSNGGSATSLAVSTVDAPSPAVVAGVLVGLSALGGSPVMGGGSPTSARAVATGPSVLSSSRAWSASAAANNAGSSAAANTSPYGTSAAPPSNGHGLSACRSAIDWSEGVTSPCVGTACSTGTGPNGPGTELGWN